MALYSNPTLCSVALDFFQNNVADMSDFSIDNIYISDDMSNDIYIFCKPMPWERLDSDGVTLAADEHLRKVVILINLNGSDRDQALFHELTHAHDFISFSKFYYNEPFAHIRKHPMYRTYCSLSEFKAFAYGIYYCDKFFDEISENYESVFQTTVINALNHTIAEKYSKLLAHKFTDYDFSMISGYCYAIDLYNQVHLFEKSCCTIYFPLLFRKDRIDRYYKLYQIFFESVENHLEFQNLEKLAQVRETVFRKV